MCYVVDKKLIDALVTYGLYHIGFNPFEWLWPSDAPASAYKRGVGMTAVSVIIAQERKASLTSETADRVGQTLWDENVRSVNHRYDTRQKTPCYRFTRCAAPLTTPNVLGLIDCLAYQSCENPDWKASEAFAILHTLRSKAIVQLPGYDWKLPKRKD